MALTGKALDDYINKKYKTSAAATTSGGVYNVSEDIAKLQIERETAKRAKQQSQPKPNFFRDMGQDILQTGKNIVGTAQKTVGKVQEAQKAYQSGEQGLLRTAGQALGSVAGGVSGGIGDVMTGGVKSLVPEEGEQAIKAGIQKVAPAIMELDKVAGSPIGNLMSKYESLDDAQKRDVDALLGIGSLALDLTGFGIGKKVVTKTGSELLEAGTKVGAKVATKAGELAEQGTKKIAPVIEMATDITKETAGSLKTLPTKADVFLKTKQAGIKAIESLPTPQAKQAAQLGVKVDDVKTLLNIPKEIKSEAQKLFQSVKDFSSGVSKVRPEEVVGKPIVSALKTLENTKNQIGKKLGEVSKNLGTVTEQELFNPILNKLKGVIDGLEFRNGKLNFSNTVLATAETASDRKAIQKIFEQAVKWGTGEKKHKLRQELFEILGGKKRSLQNITVTQEKAYKAIRNGLADVLDTKNKAYKKLNQEYAKAFEPLGQLRKMLKVSGEEEDILDMAAGLLARRLTSNAPSNPQLREILRNIDNVLKSKGKNLPKIEAMQDLYNIFDTYYDIAAKTGFQGQVKTAFEKGGDIIGRAFDTATKMFKETPEVRQKGLEDLFNSLF